jgi:hypothetical protein
MADEDDMHGFPVNNSRLGPDSKASTYGGALVGAV